LLRVEVLKESNVDKGKTNSEEGLQCALIISWMRQEITSSEPFRLAPFQIFVLFWKLQLSSHCLQGHFPGMRQ
jgi:hypothetical protein